MTVDLTLNLKDLPDTPGPVDKLCLQLMEARKRAAANKDSYSMVLLQTVADLLDKHHELDQYLTD